MGTLSFRIAEIENSIPYADVKKEFGKDRERWVSGINEHHGSRKAGGADPRIARGVYAVVQAKFIFADDPGGFERLRKGCQHVIAAPAKKAGGWKGTDRCACSTRFARAAHNPRAHHLCRTCPGTPERPAPPPAASPSPFPSRRVAPFFNSPPFLAGVLPLVAPTYACSRPHNNLRKTNSHSTPSLTWPGIASFRPNYSPRSCYTLLEATRPLTRTPPFPNPPAGGR